MKSILISIKPEWVAKILNGEKIIEIRKTAPKEWADYLNGKTDRKPNPMKVYIYCTNGRAVAKPNIFHHRFEVIKPSQRLGPKRGCVCAKFTLREVEKCVNPFFPKGTFATKTATYETLLEQSCLNAKQLDGYLGKGKRGYAWHISDLVIFGKVKELEEFKQTKLPNPKKIKFANWEANYYWALGDYCNKHPQMMVSEIKRTFDNSISIKRAPQSWCYVEVK